MRKLGPLLVAALPLAACMSVQGGADPIGVALSVGGDDGETQRLAEALRNHLHASERFRVTLAQESPDATVTIADHVQWYPVRGVDFIEYHVVFGRPGDAQIGESIGRCPSRRMQVCASRIVSDFAIALRSGR